MSRLAIVLSGHDDSCCRSHSMRNFLLLLKVKSEMQTKSLYADCIDIYVHPSEFLFLYRSFAKYVFPDFRISVKRDCDSLSDYDEVIGCLSTVFKEQDHPPVKIYDPALRNEYILESLDDAEIL